MLTNVPILPVVESNEDYNGPYKYEMHDKHQYVVVGQIPTPQGIMLLLVDLNYRLLVKVAHKLVPVEAVKPATFRAPPSDLL